MSRKHRNQIKRRRKSVATNASSDAGFEHNDPLVYPEKTSKGQSYKFHPKHHFPAKGDHGIWARKISHKDEFMLFADAETQEFIDNKHNLYNVKKDQDNEFITIGTRSEIVAKFPSPAPNSEWHGYPMWPIKTKQSLNRASQEYGTPKEALQRLVEKEKITKSEKARLMRGDF